MTNNKTNSKAIITALVIVLLLSLGLLVFVMQPLDKGESEGVINNVYTELPLESSTENITKDESVKNLDLKPEYPSLENDEKEENISLVGEEETNSSRYYVDYSTSWKDEIVIPEYDNNVTEDLPIDYFFEQSYESEYSNDSVQYDYESELVAVQLDIIKDLQEILDNSGEDVVNAGLITSIPVINKPLSLSGYKNCGTLLDIDDDETEKGVISKLLNSSALICLGESFINDCAPSFMKSEYQTVYLSEIAGLGCAYGTSVQLPDSTGQDISFCSAQPSNTFSKEFDELGIKMNDDERELDKKFKELRIAQNLLSDAEAEFNEPVVIYELKNDIESIKSDVKAISGLKDRTYSLIAMTIDMQVENCVVYKQ